MEKLLELDSHGLFSDALNLALPVSTKNEDIERILATHRSWTAEGGKGPIHSGFRQETLRRAGLAESLQLAEEKRKRFTSLVVLGIGGSALGARTALSVLDWTVPEKDRRQVFITDNLDPIDFEKIWAQLNIEETLFAVVTKSGGTIETIAQFSVVLDRLAALKLNITDHIVAITDPSNGSLRAWCEQSGAPSLAIPSTVGGRFSVFTPVAIFPLAFAGINVEALIEGAEKAFQGHVYALENVAKLALRLAELEEGGFSAHVLMPYATLLKDFGSWFVQLWGESLGKVRSPGARRQNPTGPVPVAAVGATDQHSLLQLLVEGRSLHLTGFIGIETWPPYSSRQPTMCKLPAEFASLSYAHGKSFGEILNAEMRATRQVLEERARPCYQITLSSPVPAALGALFAFYMDLVTLTAAALEVNPFDQPGVEFGKKILPKLLA